MISVNNGDERVWDDIGSSLSVRLVGDRVELAVRGVEGGACVMFGRMDLVDLVAHLAGLVEFLPGGVRWVE